MIVAFERFGAVDAAAKSTRFECGICWTIYDPALGDSVWQIPPGIAFADLPAHWTCPNCDAPRTKFMAVTDD